MAGLKSPSKRKRDSSKPNTVLVVFLVFFILISIGLGVWGYYGYADKDKMQATTKEKVKAATDAKDYELYALFIANEARTAIGAPGNPKDKVLDPDQAQDYATRRE